MWTTVHQPFQVSSSAFATPQERANASHLLFSLANSFVSVWAKREGEILFYWSHEQPFFDMKTMLLQCPFNYLVFTRSYTQLSFLESIGMAALIDQTTGLAAKACQLRQSRKWLSCNGIELVSICKLNMEIFNSINWTLVLFITGGVNRDCDHTGVRWILHSGRDIMSFEPKILGLKCRGHIIKEVNGRFHRSADFIGGQE